MIGQIEINRHFIKENLKRGLKCIQYVTTQKQVFYLIF